MAEVLPSDELVEEPSDYGSLQPGTRLGRYELLVPIARGGMARVWAARLHGQRGFQKLVAIKTILPHLAQEQEFERMFLDEARIASGVHHPNVCEIYELGEEKRTLYLAMEWVSGDSLSRVLRTTGKTEALDARVVARIVADACAGLHAAHELTDDNNRALGVVHRDLSPHNILLSHDGVAKVADFGVAKALGQLHDATSAGQLKGKLAYMAPEQITGGAVDRRSDVFSLGVVLYEATTGVRPFRGDGDHQVMHAVLKGEVPSPTSILRSYPPDLERIVMRALSPQPLLRFPTAERMRFSLEEFLAKGQLVTTSHVAQVVRARIGEHIERRKERIKHASNMGDTANDGRPAAAWSEPPHGMTPSHQAHRSGVKPSGSHAAGAAQDPQGARPLFSTMQMDRSPMAGGAFPPPHTPPMVPAVQSSTMREAPPFAPVQGGPSQGSYPGAAYSSPGHTPQGLAAHPTSQPPLPPPPARPLAQTALMPPQVSLPHDMASGAMTPNPLAPAPQLQAAPFPAPYTVPPASSLPPSGATYGPGSGGPFGAPAGEPSMSEGRASNPPAAGQYAIAIGVGVLLAMVIGGGGYFAWRSRHSTPSADPSPAVASATATPVPVAVSATASASAGAPVSAEIAFTLTPADATLSVDGVDLPSGAKLVPRPPVGKNVMVTARAPGHEDQTVSVDFFTTSPKELVLKRLDVAVADAGAPAASDVTGAAAAGAVTATATAAVTAAPPTGGAPATAKPVTDKPVTDKPAAKPARPKPAEPGLPANPY
ncbi:MAG: protein kinase [Deltaproteobacteria bacterium]|nr:protein kinase [Deltaproteobacteria bacterium]